MLHPVGELPAAVYWRRRLVVLILLLAVLAGAGWLGYVLVTRREAEATTAAATTSAPSPARTPALERVVPSMASVSAPTPPEVAPAEATPSAEAVTGPVPGGPCTDDMISVEVRTPPTVPPGSKPAFELVITNVAATPCVRTLDKGLQEIAMYDSAGGRVWGSNDCFPEASSDTRILTPGEAVTFPVLWGGLTSEPTCTAARAVPAAGAYVLRGRLDARISPDVPFAIG